MAKPRKSDGPGPEKEAKKADAATLHVAGGLTYRQRLFVAAYLGQAKGSASEAARLAGYSAPHSQGSRLLENVGVRAAIAAHLSQAAMSADEVLARLSEMATVDLADFISIRQDEARVDLGKARRLGKTHLVKAIKPTRFGLSLVLHDSQAALQALGRYHGLFGPRTDEQRDVDDAEVDARAVLQGLLDRLAGSKPVGPPGGPQPG